MSVFAIRVVRSEGSHERCHAACLPPGLPVLALISVLGVPTQAQRIENSVAHFAALDKVTAGVRQLPIGLNQTAAFRSLKITPRACYTRDPKEPPRTSTFVEIDEILIDGKEKRIFTGWM